MAATLGGMMRAPIMAVAFAFELTHDVNALLPVMAASAVAYAFTVTTMHRSILTEKIARRGYHIYREYGIDPMERHSVAEVMTPAPLSIDAGARLADVLASHFNETQRHRAFPVTRDGALVGMLDRPTLLERLPGNGDLTAGELFGVNMPVVALADETCRALATRLAVHELERLPVVSDARTLRLIGIVSRSDLVKPALGLQSEEVQRQTVRRLWPLQRQR